MSNTTSFLVTVILALGLFASLLVAGTLISSQRPTPPGTAAPPGEVSGPARLAALVTAERRRDWRHIIIHHSATAGGSAAAFDRYHREKKGMRNGMAYHFVIGNGQGVPAGRVEVGPRWVKQLPGGHVRSAAENRIAIGLCLVGNFQEAPPGEEQLGPLVRLTAALCRLQGLGAGDVYSHTEIHPGWTECPGACFPLDEFRRRLAAALETEAPLDLDLRLYIPD